MKKLPINESVLADVRFECTMLSTYVERHRKNARQLAEYAQELNEEEALNLNVDCALQVRDIKRCAADVSMYLGMADMLLGNIKSDLNKIDHAREEFKKAAEKKEKDAKNAAKQKRYREAQKSASGN